MISKSAFIRGVQCQKALYLYKNFYNVRDKLSTEQLAKFKRGTQVGTYAQNLFPNGVDCSPRKPGDSETWVKNTHNQISENKTILYEAAFEFNGSMAAMDIFTQINGKYEAYEVKSSLKVSSVYEIDLAFQTYIISRSGHLLNGAGIITVNADYQKNGDINWHQYFQFSDYSQHLKLWHPWIEEQIAQAEKTLSQNAIPRVGIGKQCFEPYACDFMKFCWKKPLAENWKNTSPYKNTHHQLFEEKGLIESAEYQKSIIPNEFAFMLFAASAIPMLNGSKPYQKTPLALLLVNLMQHRFEIVWMYDEEEDQETLISHLKNKMYQLNTSFEVMEQTSADFFEKSQIEIAFKAKQTIEKVMSIQSEFRMKVDNEVNSLKAINNNDIKNLLYKLIEDIFKSQI